MIGFLSGVARTPDIVLCGGVGYRVATPDPLPVGETVDLHVVTIVREDALDLFGFTTEAEEHLFRVLIRASGVGPKLALTLLAALGAAPVARAIADGDHKALSAARGVGPKLAQTMCTAITIPDDLLLALGAVGAPAGGTDGAADELDDVAAALVELGFTAARAVEAADAARSLHPNLDDAGALVRFALIQSA